MAIIEESLITSLISEFADGSIGLRRSSILQTSFSIKYHSIGKRVYNVHFLLNGSMLLKGYNMEGKPIEINIKTNHMECFELLFPNEIYIDHESLKLEKVIVGLSLYVDEGNNTLKKKKRTIHFPLSQSQNPSEENDICFGEALYNSILNVEKRKKNFETSVTFQEVISTSSI